MLSDAQSNVYCELTQGTFIVESFMADKLSVLFECHSVNIQKSEKLKRTNVKSDQHYSSNSTQIAW